MASPERDETERAILKAIRKHLRDEQLAAALAWLKARTNLYKAWSRLG